VPIVGGWTLIVAGPVFREQVKGSDLPRGEGGDDCCLVALEDVADLTVDRLEYCSLDKPMESGSLLTALAEIVRNNSVRQE
jgi:hypothetical protein